MFDILINFIKNKTIDLVLLNLLFLEKKLKAIKLVKQNIILYCIKNFYY